MINANYPVDGDWPSQTGRAVMVDRVGVSITWAPTLVKRIRALAENRSVDLVWASAWCPVADKLEDLWDLPKLVRAWTHPMSPTTLRVYKWRAWQEAQASPRPVIWTDDECAEEIDNHDRELLGIRPATSTGLTRPDMNRIEQFIDRYTPDLSKETR
ncbi:HAD domain-containing protein [Glycomyces sp. NPDC048151]|uniref:HAD domain-containing protein n=1 Tax=Glycomyces sp. NPDC048151 TaxID=3364002 RepID=UPI00371BA459